MKLRYTSLYDKAHQEATSYKAKYASFQFDNPGEVHYKTLVKNLKWVWRVYLIVLLISLVCALSFIKYGYIAFLDLMPIFLAISIMASLVIAIVLGIIKQIKQTKLAKIRAKEESEHQKIEEYSEMEAKACVLSIALSIVNAKLNAESSENGKIMLANEAIKSTLQAINQTHSNLATKTDIINVYKDALLDYEKEQ